MMEVVFYNVTDNPKKISKSLKNGTTMEVNYHIETNQYSPVIRVSYSDTQEFETNGFNYVKITGVENATSDWEKRDKFFFISQSESIGKGLFNIHLKCDVLMTYKPEILKQNVTIARCSDLSLAQLYANDNMYTKLAYPQQDIYKFPSGFGAERILLVVNGG